MNAVAISSAGGPPRHLGSTRTQYMAITDLLNDDGPPHKYQRVDRGFWGSGCKEATAHFETPVEGRCPPPPTMGPPESNDTTRIQSILNTPEPEKGHYSTVDKRGFSAVVSKIVCETCGEGFTCDSLLRKHQAKHTKPFKCKQKGCERMQSGFTSPNDLKRHENSVHKGTKGPAVGYNCIYDHCRDRNKIYFRLDNFRNHLKKLHSTRDARCMGAFLKQAESECRVEVNPEDVHQESASETNCSSVRTRRNTGSMSFSQRKNRKLQWVVTRVDNGNLHRPRPAYYGPLEEDSSDMDPSDLENTSPRIQGYQGMPPTSPGVQNRMNSEPISPRAMGHNIWTAALPQEREENIARRKQMQDIQSQMSHMKRQLDLLEAQYRELEAQESKELQTQSIQASGVGAQVTSQFNSPGEAREARSVPPLNPRNLEDYADNSNEAINRYVQQSPLEDPNPLLFISRQDGTKAGQADRRASGQETGADTVSMLSPPETVASPPGENPPGSGGPNGQEVQKQPIQAVQPYARPRAPLQPYPPPIQLARAPTNAPGACKVAKGPVEKIYRCGHPGCKSTFARNCELRKHRKRHTRPYGCTARYCQRLFGSKNDWKRHENSQHHRLESWKCNVPVHPHGAGDICKAIHYRKENFVNHLKSSAHGIRTETEIKRWAERSYIGGSDHHIFWCGFCVDESGVQGKTINLKKQGLAGWDERFNHLGSHFEQGCSIKQYKYQDEDAVHDCPSLSDSDDDDESAILPDPLESSPSLLQLANAAATIIHSSPANPTANPEENLAPVNVQSNPSNPSKRARSDKTWYCCKCLRNTGFSHVSLVDLQPSCLDCEHALCNECRQEQANQAEPSAGGAPARSSTRRKRQ